MHPGPPRPRRSRPVADVPLHALLARQEDLTKGWLLALIENAPLPHAGAILSGGVVREGPRLCEAILRALVDDEELRAIDRHGQTGQLAFQAGELAGAADAESALRAVDGLAAVIWTAALQSLRDPEADTVARLAERWATVMDEVRAAAVRRYSGAAAPPPDTTPFGGPTPVPGPSPVPGPTPVPGATPVPGPTPAAGPTQFAGPTPFAPPAAAAAGGSAGIAGRLGGSERAGPPLEPMRDELWVRALDEEIVRSQGAGMALALLLVELEEAERLRMAEKGTEAGASFGRFAQAMRTALRRRDILACETDTRAWIVARDTMRAGAQSLGGRIAGAVQEAEPWRGAPLTVSVGVAVLGEDGQDREALMGAAEQDRFAAAATGTPVAGAIRPDGEPGGPPDGWAS